MKTHVRKSLCFLAVLSVSMLTLTAEAEILIDNFDAGNDDGWTRIDTTGGHSWGPGDFNASSFPYRLETGAVVPQNEVGMLASTWNKSSEPLFSDGFLKAKVRAHSDRTLPVLLMRMQEPFGQFSCYGFGANPYLGRFFCMMLQNGEVVAGDSFYADERFDAHEDWIIEAGAVGDQLSMKVWKDGEAEPSQPQWTYSGASLFPTGSFGVGAYHGASYPADYVRAVFDDIYFTVPEPTSFLLAAIGAVALLAAARWRRKRQA